MSDYPPPDDRYPPLDQDPTQRGPRRPSRPSSSFDDGQIPDLRQRSSVYREAQRQSRSRPTSRPASRNPEQDGDDFEVDEAYTDQPSLAARARSGCMGLNLSGMDWIFVVTLVLAAARGFGRRQGGNGCLPTRRCFNIVVLNLGGLALIGWGIYIAATNSESSRLGAAMSGAGVLLCLFGGGSIIALLAFTVRMLDLDNLGENALEDVGGGFLSNILGGRR